MMRLHRYLALAGVASRRAAEQMIAIGRVSVNGKTVTEMGVMVSEEDKIAVDGRPVRLQKQKVSIIYYKPKGVVTTVSDPQGRPTVMDQVKDVPVRVYPVGRLDMDTQGLLVLTNDGEMALRMTHPRYGLEKTYVATIRGHLSAEEAEQLQTGIMLDDRMTAPARLRILPSGKSGGERVEIVLHEGRNRQVRRMFDAVGHAVVELTRVKVGPLSLSGLRPGQWRRMTADELHSVAVLLNM